MTVISRPWIARGIAIASFGVAVWYVLWRLTATLNLHALPFSLLLLAAEAQGLFDFGLFAFMTWDTGVQPPFRLQPGLSVAVFVPTYNEDIDILQATLVGCASITYPHVTYVLDDGRRPQVRELAQRIGCRYLTRPDNKHAKAGNLNAALAHTDEDFIVVIDADTVPQPDFLDHTLGYFCDERVALVQLPQEFYNRDSFQHHGDGDWHEQTLFYRVIQPGKNRWNAAFWCGSPSVVRRRALEDVGGVATETITEDLHTTVRLHARGWKTVYHDEALAFGIAPQTFSAFALQRLRWAQGTMQLLRSRENPLIVPGLTLAQRLNYLGSTGTYFDAFQKLVLFLSPPIILFTGVLPVHVGAESFLLHWLPYIALGTLANIALGCGQFRYLQVERYNLLKMFTFLHASLTLLWPRPLRFRVTPKRTDATVYDAERRQLRPQLLLAGLLALACVIASLNLVWGFTASYHNPHIIMLTLFWAVLDVGVVLLGVRDVMVRRHARQSYRFPVKLGVAVQSGGRRAWLGEAIDLSRQGAAVRLGDRPRARGRVGVTLELPDGPLRLRAEVLRTRQIGDGAHELGLRFVALSARDEGRLLRFLFVTLPAISWQQRAAADDAPLRLAA